MIKCKIDVLKNEFANEALKLRQRAGQISQQSAYRGRDSTKQRVHVISGALRNSVDAIKLDYYTWLVTMGGGGVDYAEFEEHGTRFRPAHPALTPAMEEERANFAADVRKLVRF